MEKKGFFFLPCCLVEANFIVTFNEHCNIQHVLNERISLLFFRHLCLRRPAQRPGCVSGPDGGVRLLGALFSACHRHLA